MNTIEKFDNYVMNTYGRFGVALEKEMKEAVLMKRERIYRFRQRYRYKFPRLLRQ